MGFNTFFYEIFCKFQAFMIGLKDQKFRFGTGELTFTSNDHKIGPTTIFLHGLTGNRMVWHSLLRRMGNLGPVVLLDLPGHGSSPDVEPIDSRVSFHAEIVKKFILEKNLTNVRLVGSSMGGEIAFALASDCPELVKEIVLINPTLITPQNRGRVHKGVRDDENIFLSRSHDEYRRFLATVMRKPPWIPRFAFHHLAALHVSKRDQIREQFTSFVNGPSIARRIDDLRVPTLVIWGNEDQVLASDLEVWRLSAMVKVKEYEGVGHLPHLEVPAMVAGDLKRFFGV